MMPYRERSFDHVERDYKFTTVQSREIAQYRAEKISIVLAELVIKRALNVKNLEGRVADLGTGYGAGVIALEEFSPRSIVGVDIFDYPFGYDARGVLGHRFVQQEAGDFLEGSDGEFDLITVFSNGRLVYKEEEAMKKLKVGGQFLVTSDDYMLPGISKYMDVYKWKLSLDGEGWVGLENETFLDTHYYVKTKL